MTKTEAQATARDMQDNGEHVISVDHDENGIYGVTFADRRTGYTVTVYRPEAWEERKKEAQFYAKTAAEW